MAIRLKTTRIRPNTGVEWRTEDSDNAAATYYNETYIDTGKIVEISNTQTDLQKVSIKEFINRTELDAFVADLANTASPLYARTQYNSSNGITVDHEIL